MEQLHPLLTNLNGTQLFVLCLVFGSLAITFSFVLFLVVLHMWSAHEQRRTLLKVVDKLSAEGKTPTEIESLLRSARLVSRN